MALETPNTIEAGGTFDGFDPATNEQHDAPHLFDVRDLVGSRARRLAADVEEIGALLHEPRRVGERGVRLGVPAAIRERVRGDVDDAHQECPRAERERPATGQREFEESRWRAKGPPHQIERRVDARVAHQPSSS